MFKRTVWPMGSPRGPALANIFVGYHEMQKPTGRQGVDSPIVYYSMLMTFLLCLSLGRHVTISRHGSTFSIQRWSLPRCWTRQTRYHFWTCWLIDPTLVSQHPSTGSRLSQGSILGGTPPAPRDTKSPRSISWLTEHRGFVHLVIFLLKLTKSWIYSVRMVILSR